MTLYPVFKKHWALFCLHSILP